MPSTYEIAPTLLSRQGAGAAVTHFELSGTKPHFSTKSYWLTVIVPDIRSPPCLPFVARIAACPAERCYQATCKADFG